MCVWRFRRRRRRRKTRRIYDGQESTYNRCKKWRNVRLFLHESGIPSRLSTRIIKINFSLVCPRVRTHIYIYLLNVIICIMYAYTPELNALYTYNEFKFKVCFARIFPRNGRCSFGFSCESYVSSPVRKKFIVVLAFDANNNKIQFERIFSE